MKFVIGIDVACRASHVAAGASETGEIVWSGVRLRTTVEDLESLWHRLPSGTTEVTVVMEPTRNAWVPLASWFRRQGATVVMVPPEQSSDLRAYFSKHAKNDRLDAQLLARLPSMHREGLHEATGDGPADPLRRATRQRASLVLRRATCMNRLDALLEIMGPQWVDALGSAMTTTAFKFLAKWAHPLRVQRVGRARLSRWFCHEMRRAHGADVADQVLEAARATLNLWGPDGLDFDELASDIAVEAEVALELSRQIKELDRRIDDLYVELDPARIVMSVPGVGAILAAQILGRLGDVNRFSSLAAVRSFSGLVPKQNSSGLVERSGGPTKRGDAALRGAIFQAANTARTVDPTLAQRYQRLMMEAGRHHNSALCSVAAILLTRIATCIRSQTPYVIRDVDGREITASEGRAIVRARYQISPQVRASRRAVSDQVARRKKDERSKKGVAKRSEDALVPIAS